MRIKTKLPVNSQPLVRVRFMAIGLVLLAFVISGPLLIVAKQAYITNVSMKMNALSDSLKIVNEEIASLQLTAERLSSNARVEEFARKSCNLDYPGINQIVIVKMKHNKNKMESVSMSSMLDVINKSLGVRN
jgi:cell division protein FtsL